MAGRLVYGLGKGTPPAPDPLYGTRANLFGTDVSFRCAATTLQLWHAQQGSPVYAYQFEQGIGWIRGETAKQCRSWEDGLARTLTFALGLAPVKRDRRRE